MIILFYKFSLHLYNSNINGEQLQAVRNIYEGPRNDATYIIFGPPGIIMILFY